MGIFGIFIFWNDYNFSSTNEKDKNDPFTLKSGGSELGLLIFYILGVYIGKYIIVENRNRRIYYYAICIMGIININYFYQNFVKEKIIL